MVACSRSKNFNQVVTILRSLLSPKTRFLDGEVQTYWKQSMKTEVNTLVSQNPSYQIWVTGHSMGGTMASLASTWLAYYNVAPRKNIILYTFGMPRTRKPSACIPHTKNVKASHTTKMPHAASLKGSHPILSRDTKRTSAFRWEHSGKQTVYPQPARGAKNLQENSRNSCSEKLPYFLPSQLVASLAHSFDCE